MNRTVLLGTLAGALVLAVAAAFMLSDDDAVAPGGTALQRARGADPDSPGFHGTTGERAEAAPPVTRVESLPAAATLPTAPSAAAEPTGPVRSISGRVLRRSDDTPLGGATVARTMQAEGDDGARQPAPGGVDTGETDGTFTLTGVPLSETEVCVAFDGTGDHATAYFPLPEVEGDIHGLALTYDSGFIVRGLVTDAGGLPIAGATAAVDERQRTTSDSGGRFELRDVKPSGTRLSVDVWAQAPWYQRETSALKAPTDSRQVVSVTLALAGSGAIEGRVTDESGRAIPGTEVSITATMTEQHGNAGAAHLSTKTDDDGHYRLDHLAEGRYLVQVGSAAFAKVDAGTETERWLALRVEEERARPGSTFAMRWFPDVFVTVGAATPLDVVLDHGAVIEGRVTDVTGAPLAGAGVTLERLMRWAAPEQGGSSVSYDGVVTISSQSAGRIGAENEPGQTILSVIERTAKTGADGTYRFEIVSAGDKRLAVIDADKKCSPLKRELTVAGTEAHAAVDFALSFGLTLRGRVTDPGGAPLQGATAGVQPAGSNVFTQEHSVATDADGWFEVIGLAEGPHQLMLNKAGYGYRFEEVQPGDVPRTWVLTPAPKLHIVVLDAQTSAPVLRYSVTVSLPRSIMTSGDGDHADGAFTFDANDDTPASVSVTAIGFETESKDAIIPSTTEGAPVVFHLTPRP